MAVDGIWRIYWEPPTLDLQAREVKSRAQFIRQDLDRIELSAGTASQPNFDVGSYAIVGDTLEVILQGYRTHFDAMRRYLLVAAPVQNAVLHGRVISWMKQHFSGRPEWREEYPAFLVREGTPPELAAAIVTGLGQ